MGLIIPKISAAMTRNNLSFEIVVVDDDSPYMSRCWGSRRRRAASVVRRILAHIGYRFAPLSLPGRSPPAAADGNPLDPFPDYGPQ